MNQSKERSSLSQPLDVVAIEKEAFRASLIKVANFTYNYTNNMLIF